MNSQLGKSDMKISIITPVYNPFEEHLHECVQSLVNQTLDNIEIILVDNGAIGNNSKILKQYEEKYSQIKLIILEKNMGFSFACNQALKIATGEYIQIVDSDDWLEKDACEKLYNKAKKFNSDIVVFGAKIWNEKRQKFEYTPQYSLDGYPYKSTQIAFKPKESENYLFYTTLQDWNKFIKRELIINTDNYFCEDLPYIFPDCIFSIKALLSANCIICEKSKLYNYRTNINSSIVKGYSKPDCNYLNHPIIFAQKINNIIEKLDDLDCYIEHLIGIVIWHLLYYYDLAHKKNKKTVYNMMRNFLLNVDKKIYTKQILKRLGLYKQVRDIKLFSFEQYKIKNFIYRSLKRNNVTKKYLFNICIYKEKYANFKIYKKYFGLFKFKEEDWNARMEYTISKITDNFIGLINERTEK